MRSLWIPPTPRLDRRRFVTGAVAATALVALDPVRRRLTATPPPSPPLPELRGSRFSLTIGPQPVAFTGRPRLATAVNGSVPGPVLRWREGDEVTIDVSNHLAETTSIHWHGIILPFQMDGVPEISFPGIAPGATFRYRFRVRQAGTYWYHSHSGFQEQTGLYGPLVIEPATPEPYSYHRDLVVMLSDWSDDDPAWIYASLKKQSDYYSVKERTVADLFADIRRQGLAATWRQRAMWNWMRMSDRDLSDVTGSTYTFLMNGVPPAAGWTATFRRGERLRLRLINGSAMTFFDFRIPGLPMTVVAADGQDIEPVTVDEIRIGVAETYDVIVTPPADRAWCLFAQALDRSGYARGTLTPDPALPAPVPELDPVPVLGHQDMGMAMHMANNTMTHGHHVPTMAHGHQGHATAMAASPAMGLGPAGTGSSAPVVHKHSEFGPQVDSHAEAPRYRLDDPGPGLRDNGRRVLTYADLANLHPTADRREPEREIQLHLTGNMARYMWSIDGIRYADADPIGFRYGERLRLTLVNDTMMHHPMHLHGMWSELETGDPGRIPRKHTVVVQPGAKISYLVTADALGGWAYHCHLLYHMLGMFRKVEVS